MNVQELAKEPCPECKGEGEVAKFSPGEAIGLVLPCEACHGTRLKWWMLWEKCPGWSDEFGHQDCNNGKKPLKFGDTEHSDCPTCGGFGYVLKSEPEQESALMDRGADSFGSNWCLHHACAIRVFNSPIRPYETVVERNGKQYGEWWQVVNHHYGTQPRVRGKGATRLAALKDPKGT